MFTWGVEELVRTGKCIGYYDERSETDAATPFYTILCNQPNRQGDGELPF